MLKGGAWGKTQTNIQLLREEARTTVYISGFIFSSSLFSLVLPPPPSLENSNMKGRPKNLLVLLAFMFVQVVKKKVHDNHKKAL